MNQCLDNLMIPREPLFFIKLSTIPCTLFLSYQDKSRPLAGSPEALPEDLPLGARVRKEKDNGNRPQSYKDAYVMRGRWSVVGRSRGKDSRAYTARCEDRSATT